MNDMQPKIARLATETMNTAAANAASFGNAGNAQARVMLEKGMAQATKTADFARGNVEVFAQVTQTWMVGSQDLSRQAFAFVQSLTDSALEGARALAGVKSMKEAAEIQTTFARTTMDRVMNESARLQQASFRLVEQVSAPVTQRVTQAVERATRPIAA